MELNLKKFVNSYLATAAWVTCDSGENQNFTREAKKRAEADCLKFINDVCEKLGNYTGEALLTIGGKDLDYLAAHDFFLTRNRHGAGFFDKTDKYGVEHAKILTDIAHAQKEVNCYHVNGWKSRPLTFD
jgi:hypothetical protein